MAQAIFKRIEKKFLLTREQYFSLMSVLVTKMEPEEYGRYTISNIYFDTEDYDLIRSSLEKPLYKEKLRLRCYGEAQEDSTVFIELKKKYDGVVYKRRVPMALRDARKYLYYGIYPEESSQILREIDYARLFYDLKPAAFVAYDRTAFFARENRELRVTFDNHIRCRKERLDLIWGTDGTELLREDQILMEVKIPGAMPVWMSHLFGELSIYPASFSKYGTYYHHFLFREELFTERGYAPEAAGDGFGRERLNLKGEYIHA